MAVRSRKIIQAQGVQICSICSNVFRCVLRYPMQLQMEFFVRALFSLSPLV